MICKKCGNEVADNARFCDACGARLENDDMGELSDRVTLCSDGKYRWYYEFAMMKNPVILFTVFRVLMLASLAPTFITFIAGLTDHFGFRYALKNALSCFGICAAIMLVLGVIAYIILAGIYGWKYIVLFEMDDEGVTHSQQDKQFKKAEAIAWLTAFAGAKAGSFTVSGAGLNAMSKNSTTSVFENADSVIGLRGQHTIKVNQTFAKNQVYVCDEDYDFVWDYITSRCKKAKITK